MVESIPSNQRLSLSPPCRAKICFDYFVVSKLIWFAFPNFCSFHWQQCISSCKSEFGVCNPKSLKQFTSLAKTQFQGTRASLLLAQRLRNKCSTMVVRAQHPDTPRFGSSCRWRSFRQPQPEFYVRTAMIVAEAELCPERHVSLICKEAASKLTLSKAPGTSEQYTALFHRLPNVDNQC